MVQIINMLHQRRDATALTSSSSSISSACHRSPGACEGNHGKYLHVQENDVLISDFDGTAASFRHSQTGGSAIIGSQVI